MTDDKDETEVKPNEPAALDETDAADDTVEDADETVEDADETVEDADETDTLEKDLKLGSGKSRRRRGFRSRIGTTVVTAALVLSAVLAVSLYFLQYRPDQETDTAAAQVALDAATSGTAALLSYSPESLEQDFTAAKTHLTGDFLDYYTQFTQTIVTPAAKQKEVKTSASVVQSALAELHPESAVALVFVNQTTLSKENPDGAFAASSVKVGLTKIDGTWLIASFDPV